MNYKYCMNFTEFFNNYSMDFIAQSRNYLFKANIKTLDQVVKYVHS